MCLGNMWRLTIAFILLLYCGRHASAIHTEEGGLELLFRERTHSDWEDVWNRESHSRCRGKLVRHLYWACEKDIYRLTRRNSKRGQSAASNQIEFLQKRHNKPLYVQPHWLQHGNLMLRTRRSDAPSITDECCTKKGCTWEEYAEYCPSNKRRNHY